jgi:formylglycine-generating enzyme required for sulfatase activity
VYYCDNAYSNVAKDSTESNFVKENASDSYGSAYAKPDTTGFRLPTSDEWELAARWRGSDPTNTVSGYANPYFTKGDSASGAVADYTNATTGEVAWYIQNTSSTRAVKGKALSGLGLYDMSGNVWEWCFDWRPSFSGFARVTRGGACNEDAGSLRVNIVSSAPPFVTGESLGFRPARSVQ